MFRKMFQKMSKEKLQKECKTRELSEADGRDEMVQRLVEHSMPS